MMLGLLRRLWTDRRGNALIIAGAALPLVVGSAGLATDTIQWTMWKRQLQRAADSAALAAVYARAQDGTLTATTLVPMVNQDLSKNRCLAATNCTDPLKSGYPIVTTPANASTNIYTTRVVVAAQQRLGFSSLFMSAAPTITASATAAMIPDGEYCLVTLAKTGSAITIGGSASANLGCGAISNSVDPTVSVSTNGASYNFTADPVAAVGGMPSSINGATELQPFHVAMPDPFENKYSTAVPAGTTCRNFNQQIIGSPQGTNGVVELSPGCFNSFNGGNNTYHLNPGVYYLNNTNISLSGQTKLTGTGVTLIFTGTNPGSISMNGSSSMNLAAPTDPTNPYYKMLMIQSPNATPGNDNTINGNNDTALDGAIYFPKGDMTFTGSNTSATKCAMVVSLTAEFTGNTAIQNNTVGCTANMTVTGKQIRLIA